jgi:iron complex transport system ATP-binding protein
MSQEMISQEALLQVKNFTLRVDSKILVADLNWTVHAGERWCLIGRNGAGKSTLLKAIAGMQSQLYMDGNIQWKGRDLPLCTPEELSKLRAYGEQFPVGGIGLRSIDIVLASQWPWRGDASPNEALNHALAALARCDVEHLAYASWQFLSGGERQRVSLAACLAQSTPVLILDEPTAHLDIHHQVTLLETLVQASEACQQTVIASLHEIGLIGRGFTHALIFTGKVGGYLAGPIDEVVNSQTLEESLGHPIEEMTAGSGIRVYIPV